MDSSDEIIADIISRMIEGDMGSGEEWRPAATLDFLTQGLVKFTLDEDESKAALAKDILGDILLSMTYLELAEPDEEQEAYDRQWERIVENVFRTDHKDDEEDDDDEDE
jgi:hypothetical protein